MTDVPTYEEKKILLTLVNCGRGRELFRPPTYNVFLILVPFPHVIFIPPMHRTQLHLHVALTRSFVNFQKVFLSPSSRHAARLLPCGKVRH